MGSPAWLLPENCLTLRINMEKAERAIMMARSPVEPE
jgi:hypothetical protein